MIVLHPSFKSVIIATMTLSQQRFEMTVQSNSILLSLLLVLLLLSHAQNLSTCDNVDCVYANSTCSSCADLCLSNEFYPLFPSRCHPSYRVGICNECIIRKSVCGMTSSFMITEPNTFRRILSWKIVIICPILWQQFIFGSRRFASPSNRIEKLHCYIEL